VRISSFSFYLLTNAKFIPEWELTSGSDNIGESGARMRTVF
jgi:hypothetical protein